MTVVSVPGKSGGSATKLRTNTTTVSNGGNGHGANGGGGGVLMGEHIALSSPPPKASALKPTHAIVKLSSHCTIDYDDDDVIDVMGLADGDADALGATGGGGGEGGVITYRTEEISTHLPAGHEMLLLRQNARRTSEGSGGGAGADTIGSEIVYLNERQQSPPPQRHFGQKIRETTTLV